MEENKSKKWYQNTGLIVVILLAIILSILIVFEVFFRPNQNTEKKYEVLTLSNLKNRPEYSKDFTISNSLDIPKKDKNFYYKMNTSNPLENIRIAARQLSLTNEADNTGFYVWTRPNVNDVSGDFINYDQNLRTLSFYYSSGINPSSVQNDKILDFVTDFFGLDTNNKYKVNVVNIDSSNTNINGVLLFNDKPVYSTLVNDLSLTISVNQGKIVSGTIFVASSTTTQQTELKPIVKVGASNINFLNYIGRLKSDLSTSSNFGMSEGTVFTPATVGVRNYQEVYYYYNDPVEGLLILPAYYVTGTLVDAKSLTGKFEAIVINQDFSSE